MTGLTENEHKMDVSSELVYLIRCSALAVPLVISITDEKNRAFWTQITSGHEEDDLLRIDGLYGKVLDAMLDSRAMPSTDKSCFKQLPSQMALPIELRVER